MDDEFLTEFKARPHYRRLAAADELDDYEDTFRAQMAAIVDQFTAQCIHNERSGKGMGLRASGLTETADLLGF
jgi:hypothetical protein